jgi:hypothetical protein
MESHFFSHHKAVLSEIYIEVETEGTQHFVTKYQVFKGWNRLKARLNPETVLAKKHEFDTHEQLYALIQQIGAVNGGNLLPYKMGKESLVGKDKEPLGAAKEYEITYRPSEGLIDSGDSDRD